jgi:hypothetical protein
MKTLLLCLTLITSSLFAQLPASIIAAERAKLLEGVQSVPRLGSPGPVALWGGLAFPLLSAAEKDGVEEPLAVAAAYGKGKLILFGQNSYLNGSDSKDHSTLMANCVRWAGGKAKPQVGLCKVDEKGLYSGQGFRTESISTVDKKSLASIDVLVLNAQSVVDADAGAALLEWIKGGGGLIAGMTGWAFDQTSGGKDLAQAHSVNTALMAAGVAFTTESAFGGVQSFQVRTELPLLMNASEAITAMRKQAQGGATLDAASQKQASHAMQLALAAQPPGRNSLQEAALAAMGDTGGDARVPTEKAPLTALADAADRVKLGMQTRLLKLAGGTSAHPAHAEFPGKVPADAPRSGGTVQIQPSVPGWQSTGLYAAAGEAIAVKLPAAQAGKGYAVRIGCHSDSLYHLDKWQRAPEITRSVKLEEATTQTTSAFGGLIYIEVPGRSAGEAPFAVQIENAVAAPLFVLGKDDDSAWNSQIKKRPAPWAEFACDKVVLSCPTEVARTVSNPTMLMEFWKRVVEVQDDVANQATERRRPERIVADVQISAGYMHSGYPIMVPTSAAMEMVTFSRLKFPGWGYYHELGHNHQRPTFTFNGTGEVTNNVIGMYCYEAALGKDWLIGHTAITPESRAEHITKMRQSTDKWATWKGDPFVALTTYIQLIQEFGWPSWRSYLHSFADSSYGPAPQTDEEARDQFLVRYSKIVKADLGAFFEAWGIPCSSAAKAEAAKFPAWKHTDTP